MQTRTQERQRSRFAHVLLTGASLACVLATPAFAQEAAPAEEETITVTATRRSEDILDVPYNITAVTGAQIEQARTFDSSELLRTVPGVSVVDRGQRNSTVVSGIRIRGLNTDSSALGDYATSAVGTVSAYVNDTPIYANFLLNDLQQVEVLRGPQGTLYGSGALGGTVRYIMNQPELGEFGGHAQLSGSQVNGSESVGWGGDATVNIPIGDQFALRFSVARADYPGITDYVNLYVLDSSGIPTAPLGVLSTDPVNGAQYRTQKDADTVDTWFYRASARWQPNDHFDITFNYFSQDDEYGGRRGQTLGADGFGRPYGEYESGSVQLEPADRSLDIYSLEANWDLGFATLTSSTSSYDQSGGSISENTGFYAQIGFLSLYYVSYPRPMASAVRQFGDEAFVQEFRLVSDDGGDFDYVVGFFYQDQERLAAQQSYLRGYQQWYNAAFPCCTSDVLSDNDFAYRAVENFTQKALFGELTWHATDRLDITGGFRAFQNESDNNSFFQVGLYAAYFATATRQFHTEEEDTLFKLNVAYSFSDDDLLYATVSEGFRRGGANALPLCPSNFCEVANVDRQEYDPDRVTNYEFGIKGRIAGGPRYDASIFYVDWQDAQLNTATPVWGFFFVANAGEAHAAGIELSLEGDLNSEWSYQIGYTYLDAELDSNFCDPSPTRACPGVGLFDNSGARLPGAPEHMLNGMIDYTRPVGNYLFSARLDGFYQSETRNAVSISPFFDVDLDGFAIFNAVTSVSRDNWDFSLWVKNIGNEEGATGVYTEAYMGTDPASRYYGNGSKELISLPRTFGATLAVRF
ncbi:TonB-dependent receptor [Terricaulis sp.]|uniref:TonB-dependent receptor n=1 Tax=Terricaulis sp. TaxID=2768686 RepID=UPI003784EE45